MIQLTPLAFNWFGILANATNFLLFMIIIGILIGSYSRKLSVAAYGGLLVYVHIVIETDIWIFDALLYLVLTIILLWVAYRAVGEYLGGKNEVSV